MTSRTNTEEAGERTGLLQNGEGSGSGEEGSRRGFWLNSRYTPGMNEGNALQRYTKKAWHVTKVTLLSSKLALCASDSGHTDPVARRVVAQSDSASRLL